MTIDGSKSSTTRREYASHLSGTAIVLALVASGWTFDARAQGNPPQCVGIYSRSTEGGKSLLFVTGASVGAVNGGRVLIEVDPSCLAQFDVTKGDGVKRTDRYDEAKASVEDIAGRARAAGVPDTVVDKVKTNLDKNIEDAKQAKAAPETIVNPANEERLKEAQRQGDDNSAQVAGLAAVAGLCMVASAGVCGAALAAILPSLLPAQVSSQEVQGVARVLNDANQGKPLNAQDVKIVMDVMKKVGKASKSDASVLTTFLNEGLKFTAAQLARESGLPPDKSDKLASVLNDAIRTGRFSCNTLKDNLGDAIPVKDNRFVDQLVARVTNSKIGDGLAGPVRSCLVSYFIVQ